MKKIDLKKFSKELLIDIIGGLLLALAVYNFASNAGFPVAGISGVALIIYHLTGLPMGAVTLALNVPIIIICYKFLGRDFFIRSLKTMIISSFLLDYVAPLLPVYEGDRLLAAICTGVLQGHREGLQLDRLSVALPVAFSLPGRWLQPEPVCVDNLSL